MRRSFWALVLLALVGEAAAAFLAERALAAQLPCRIGSWTLPVSEMATCAKPLPLIGHHALAPALLIGALALATVVSAGLELARQLWRLRRVRQQITALARVTGELPGRPNVGLRRLVVLDSDDPSCFTIGLLGPAVVISTGLLAQLGPEELNAALSHEAAHVAHRDPLRLLVASVACAAAFFVPALKDLAASARVAEELAADRASAERFGEFALLSALRVLAPTAATGGAPLSTMAAEALPQRIASFAGTPPRLVLRRKRLVATTFSLLLVTVVGISIPSQVSGPKPLPVHRIATTPLSRRIESSLPSPLTSSMTMTMVP